MKKTESGGKGTWLLCLGCLFAIVLAILVLFVQQISAELICYILCAGCIVLGLCFIMRFCLNKAYLHLHNYSLTIGLFLAILGICGLVQNAALTAVLGTIFGIYLLVLGLVLLQFSVQMKLLHRSLWVAILICAVLVIAASAVVLLRFQPVLDLLPDFSYWALLCGGALDLLALVAVSFGLRRFEKQTAAGDRVEEPLPAEPEPVSPQPDLSAADAAAPEAVSFPTEAAAPGGPDAVPEQSDAPAPNGADNADTAATKAESIPQ